MSKIVIEKDISIPMRDGTVLKGDLYRPDGPQKLPVLLNRTPYGKSGPMIRLALDPIRAALRGYNVLIQDCRGRYRSEGTWTCFMSEPLDGYDTIEWAARQPWADGQVGTWGSSYMGVTQWLAANPGAAQPQGDGARAYRLRLSRRMDLPGRRFQPGLQPELDDDRACARPSDEGAGEKPGGLRRIGPGDRRY
jgi:hypothetical protein